MACWDSYDVCDKAGNVVGSTAPYDWEGCGGCPCCLMTKVERVPYTAARLAQLSEASRLADWLSQELYEGRMCEEVARAVLHFHHGAPSYGE